MTVVFTPIAALQTELPVGEKSITAHPAAVLLLVLLPPAKPACCCGLELS